MVLSLPVFWGIQASSSVAFVLADFDEPNSLSGFTQKRRDRRAVAGINVALVCLEGALGFAPSISLRMEDWDSNLDAYEFRRWQPQIDMAFLAYSF
ncbi:MAG: hypothetical protein HYY16_15095 [Planctomycetes bacterium]|nr:hypothetical protein [Planctomycetota bacterium]